MSNNFLKSIITTNKSADFLSSEFQSVSSSSLAALPPESRNGVVVMGTNSHDNYNLTFVNETLEGGSGGGNGTGPGPGEDLGESICYSVIVPILIACCLITFCMNAYIIAAFPLIRNLSRVREVPKFLCLNLNHPKPDTIKLIPIPVG